MSLLDFFSKLFTPSKTETASQIPEDSMLRRHYLANQKAQAETNKGFRANEIHKIE